MLAPWRGWGRGSYDKPRSRIKKQGHHFADKGLCSQSCEFSSSHVQMWYLDHKEGWALKNWCFWAVVLGNSWEPPDSKEVKPVNLQEINPENSLEGMMLKLQYFGHLMRRAKSLEKTLVQGKIEGGRRKGQQRMRWDGWMASPTQWTQVWINSGRWWWTGRPGVLQSMGLQSQTQLGN